MRYCAEPNCPTLVTKGRCPPHQRKHQLPSHGRDYGRPWRRRRMEFVEESYPWYCAIQGPRCTARDRTMTYDEIEVDHKVPHRGDQRLRDDKTNLQIACKSCHSAKTATEVLTGGR